jgi:hypothetical protein
MTWPNRGVGAVEGSSRGEAHVRLSDWPPVSSLVSKLAAPLHQNPCQVARTWTGYAALVARPSFPLGIDNSCCWRIWGLYCSQQAGTKLIWTWHGARDERRKCSHPSMILHSGTACWAYCCLIVLHGSQPHHIVSRDFSLPWVLK